MACNNYGLCDFAEHLEKMLELEELPKGIRNDLSDFFLNFCKGHVVGQNVYSDGLMTVMTCSSFEVTCCPRFPNCYIVRSGQIFSTDDLTRLCIETCTSLGEGRCSEVGELDFIAMLDGRINIVLSRPIEEKFKGL